MNQLHCLAATLTLAMLTGCATLSDPNLTPLQRAEAIADQDGDMIRAAVSIATRAAVQLAEADPEKRQALAGDLLRVSEAVKALSGGVVQPDALRAQMRLKEPYLKDVFEVIAPLYKAAFDRLQSATNDPATIARITARYLNIISAGVAEAAANIR